MWNNQVFNKTQDRRVYNHVSSSVKLCFELNAAVCTNGCWDFSLKTTNVNFMVALEEMSEDHQSQ